MLRTIALAGFLALTACGSTYATRYAAIEDCKREAGPQPYALAGPLFGVAGVLAAGTQPEVQAYHAQIDKCVADRMATR